MKTLIILFGLILFSSPLFAGDSVLLKGGTAKLDYLRQPEGRNSAKQAFVFVRDYKTRGKMRLSFKFRYYERDCIRKSDCSLYAWKERTHHYKLKIDFSKAFALRKGETETFEVFVRQASWNRRQVLIKVVGISTIGEYRFNFSDGWLKKPELNFIKI